MGRINLGRVVIGGLLAGLVINISETILNVVVLAPQMEAARHDRNLPPLNGAAIGGFVAFAFVLGILTIWLYAAIRPRFGPGPKTAVIAGLAVWYFAYFYSWASIALMGFFPVKLTVFVALWGLVEIVVAAVAGAVVYRE